MRFNYLRDAPPEVIERLRALCATTQVRGLLSFLATAAGVLVCAGSLEAMHLRAARVALADAQVRLDRSSIAVAALDAQARRLRAWMVLDRRLRDIRTSGAGAAMRLTLLADRLPARMWLTSMATASDGYELDGRALGLAQVGRALDADPAIQLETVHASRGQDTRIVDFQMHVPVPCCR
ncbi:MAG TPA: hypothetical protein VIN40_04785 [Candidatus Tyrphobacter sp.]